MTESKIFLVTGAPQTMPSWFNVFIQVKRNPIRRLAQLYIQFHVKAIIIRERKNTSMWVFKTPMPASFVPNCAGFNGPSTDPKSPK